VHAPNGDVAARYAGLVLQFQGTTLADVYAARKVLELAAVARVARERPQAAMLELEQNLADASAHIDEPATLIRLQEQFHGVLVRHGGNQTLAMFGEMLHHIIELHHDVYVARWGGAPTERKGAKRGERTHEQFLELVLAGDADGAEELWSRHLDAGADYLLQGTDTRTVLDLLS
jgi:DNA-binding GntR family transcriptional regulator